MGRWVWHSLAVAFASIVVVGCSSASSSNEPGDSGDFGDVTSGGDSSTKVTCGAKGPLCADGATCSTGADCMSTVCQQDKCVIGSCADGQKDGNETDVDCGGSCGGCATGKACKASSDCVSDVCKGDVCQAPTDTDGVKNDSETAIDCGGAVLATGKKNPASDGAPACAVGKSCLIGADCATGVCASGPVRVDNLDGGKATTDAGSSALTCQAATDQDGVKNDSETDVDCGGALLASGATNPASDGAPACAANKSCVLKTDCQSAVCTTGVCQAPTASDGVQNDSETDVDCGGALLANGKTNPASDGAHPCDDTLKCVLGTDCVDLVCFTGVVTTPSATGAPINCPAGATCTCQKPTPADGVQNDSETDIDCGGDFVDDVGTVNPGSDEAPTCQVGQMCALGSDCFTGVCNANGNTGGLPDDCPAGSTCVCQGASSNDGVQNGGETDIDCGGANDIGSDDAPACLPGKKCGTGADCTSFICTGNVCATPTASDGKQNGGETDVDCGGATTPTCTVTPTEDCAPPCADTLKCGADTDCLSSFCGLVSSISTTSKVCVDGQSCKGAAITPAQILDISVQAGTTIGGADAVGVQNAFGTGQSAGIDTCGAGESTDAPSAQSHESCCKSLLEPNLGACSPTVACPYGETCSSTTGAGVCQIRMDKYEVTTGRVRQFIEFVNSAEGGYNLKAWVTAQFDGSLNPTTEAGRELATMIPTNQSGAINVIGLYPTSDQNTSGQYLNVVAQLGATTLDEGVPSDAQGCFTGVGYFGASTYFWPSAEMAEFNSPPRPFTQDYYDIKPQNCTPYWIAAAFCAWDGGRLPTQAESNAVYGGSSYPWGPGSSTVPPVLFNSATNSEPGGTIDLYNQAINNGYTILTYTSNWHNAAVGASTGLGDFYYYPSYPASNPNTGPLGADSIIDTNSDGLDQSTYISAPGRFVTDLTKVRSVSGDGWLDYGANMMEYWQAQSLTGNLGGGFGSSGEYCDTADATVSITSGSCPAGTCTRAKQGTSPQEYDCGIIRATPMPGIEWEGGSWEGHGIQSGGYNEPMQTQYGKAGFRCVRPVEPPR